MLDGAKLFLTFYTIWQQTSRYLDTREDQVDQERTGGAQSTKTYKRWGSPVRKQIWLLLIDTDGVGVWPSVFIWIRDESRSRSSNRLQRIHVNFCLIFRICEYDMRTDGKKNKMSLDIGP